MTKSAIYNLTQHPATPAQCEAGVIDLPQEKLSRLRELLTFSRLPERSEIEQRAHAIAEFPPHGGSAMIGGAPYLMGPLETALQNRGIATVYAFSQRESVENISPSGAVIKTQVFRHLGFIYPAGMAPERECTCGSGYPWQECGDSAHCG